MVNIPAGTPLANAVQQAQQAIGAKDYASATLHYEQAISQLGNTELDAEIRRGLWIEHVGQLIAYEQFQVATSQSKTYLLSAQSMQDRQAELTLLIFLAEAFAAQDHWAGCRELLDSMRLRLGPYPDWEQQLGQRFPHLVRLWGLLAAQQGDQQRARLFLRDALGSFAAANNLAGQRTVLNDLRRLELMAGNAAVLNEVLNLGDLQNTSELLLVARALRRDARYESATRLLEQRFTDPVEPALRFPLLHELALIYQILAHRERIDQLLPLLEEAAAFTADPNAAKTAINRLRHLQTVGFNENEEAGFEAKLFSIRALIQGQKLPQAEKELVQLRPVANTPRFATYWSLVAGELEFAYGLESPNGKIDAYGQQALAHLNRAAQQALECSLPDVYGQAVRLIGRVYDRLYSNLDLASDYWARAARAEELIAHRQETDQTRIRYLESLPTEHDELIKAASARMTASEGKLLAGVIAAMETARGSAILSQVLPAASPRMRDVPLPSDLIACLNWFNQIAAHVPRDMAIWLLHTTPDRLYHGLIGQNLLCVAKITTDRHQLGEMIDKLKTCWEASPNALNVLMQRNPELMLTYLAQIGQMLQIDKALTKLPSRITRLAIVAGNELGDIPFAALPLPGHTPSRPLITQYALSDLPCLSSQWPLAQCAAAARGDHCLIIQPPATGLTTGTKNLRQKQIEWLIHDEATITRLDKKLQTRHFPLIRFDCHGYHWHNDILSSWLELAPDYDNDGRLTLQRFQELSFAGCGTLMLGACESGMAQRLGSDEKLGFVRAGFLTGAAAILAARWVAEDAVSNAILNRFQRYLGYLPRDRALQRAQLDVIQGRCQELQERRRQLQTDAFDFRPEHPAWWACWALYGDAGLQTNAWWAARKLRALKDRYKSITE